MILGTLSKAPSRAAGRHSGEKRQTVQGHREVPRASGPLFPSTLTNEGHTPMIPPVTTHAVTIGSTQASASFGISAADEAHLMSILREGLYSDKVLAILREYGSNAWDAHRSAGKHDLPILVTLPTYEDQTLRIRDYGPGLSHDDVFNVYTQYGKSTKRNSDDVVGMLGIGSKSGFAYSDSLTITSWHGGQRRIYSAALGDDEKGAINLLDTSDCDVTETGVEIQIATKPSDRYEFESTARRLFQHFNPRPEINIELPEPPNERTLLTNGVISPGDGEWIAIMGCVPYRVNLAQLDPKAISAALPNMSGQLTFGIGEVQVSASREELKYTAATKAALVAKANALVDEFVTHALQQLELGTTDGWQARLQVRVLSKLDLPLPEKWKAFGEGFAKITYQPGDFTITHNKAACTWLLVDTDTRLLLDDTGNDLSGYRLTSDDYVVRSVGKTPEQLRTLLDAVLVASGLTGIKIELLSTLHYTAANVPVKRKSNPKHRARMFRLNKQNHTKNNSDHWEPVLRVPTVDDVYIVFEGFKPDSYSDFWPHYAEDRQLADAFGVTMPAVYGYKSTAKNPVAINTIEGMHYRTWHEAFAKGLLTPERIALIDTYWRAHPEDQNRYGNREVPIGTQRTWVTEQLGEGHPLITMFAITIEAEKGLEGHNEQAIRVLARRNGLTYAKSAMALTIGVIKKRYPLLARNGLRNLWATGYGIDAGERDEWIEYVQLRDARDAPITNVVQLTSVP